MSAHVMFILVTIYHNEWIFYIKTHYTAVGRKCYRLHIQEKWTCNTHSFKFMGLSIPFYTKQYRFWRQYKLSFTVYRKHCNRDAMICNSFYNTTLSQVESPLLVLWQSLWLCLSCTLTSTWYGLLAETGTTTRSG